MLQTEPALAHEPEPLENAEPYDLEEPTDVELGEDDEEDDDSPVALDAESLFSAEIRRLSLLNRQEEEDLARRIARARGRIRRMLRGARRLTRTALADSGRGVVMPEEAFRERETLVILACARRELRKTHPEKTTGMANKELRRFVAELDDALTDYRTGRDRMLEANVRLVSVLARRYHHPTLSFLDLVQEGSIGLIRAIEKYEPGKNVKFSTYAVYWIWQQLSRAADTSGALIRTPVHWNQARRRLGRATPATGGAPHTTPDSADRRGIDPARFEQITQTFRFISTDTPIGDDDDRTLETMLPSEGPEPEEELLQDDLRVRLSLVVRELPDREAEIVRRRFGLGDDESETLDEIGQRFNVSRERIRQLETRALRKLKELCVAAGLGEYAQ